MSRRPHRTLGYLMSVVHGGKGDMAQRPGGYRTLTDYLMIALSSMLIMTLVGSLVYFLVEVFYQGQYSGRLHFVLAMFVMAAVLIGRISIEHGREHAQLFAVPLAIVTFLAINRFVQFHGGLLGSVSWAANLFLIGLVWWCAHKLTWDCTLVDDEEDASGEGLLQTVGLDRQATAGSPPQPEETKEPEGPTSRGAKPLAWWKRLFREDRRPHLPGVWIVYFSLAALPLFGIGQLFIPKEDPASRRYAFLLLLVYVASGLGLLLVTSFLGLRRYLRQRYLEMPPAMAGAWIAVGCVLIVGLLAVCALLPRPNAEYSLAELPFRADSPTRRSSRYAVMPGDAADEDQGGPRSGTREEDGESSGEAEEEGRDSRPGSRTDDEGPRTGAASEEGGPQAGSQGEQQGSGSESQGDSGGSRSESEAAEGSSRSQSEDRRGRSGSESGRQQEESGSGSEAEGEGSGSKSEPREEGARSGTQAEQDGSRRESEGDRDRSNAETRQQRRGSRFASSRGGSRSDDGRQTDEAERPDSETAQEDDDAGGGRSPSVDPGSILQNAGSWLATAFKWMLWAILLGAAGYWLWRNRARLLEAIRGLLEAWRGLWQRLFGGKAQPGEPSVREEAVQPPPRSFADFPNPFLTGQADRLTPEELVRYTFEALEAWARDRGYARQPDQTPHEFAVQVGTRATALNEDARRLADLYCRVAYASGTVLPKSTAPLRRLWRTLDELQPVASSGVSE